jgi:outer membrane protein assembly factor BamD
VQKILLVFLSVLLFASCSNTFEKVRKSNDINYKLSKANEYFDKKNYMKANELYQGLIPVVKGTRNFEPLYYRYAYSFYYQKEYLAASYHFKNFVDYFPSSSETDECEYMYALCLMKQSPKYSLEQTNTMKAAEAMQNYLNNHPNSKRVADANNYIDEARKKLEEKDASAAKLYYNIGQYKAAGVAYKMVLQSYPESANADYYQHMIVKSLYNYAKASLRTKQEERFSNTIDAYRELKSSYPNSKYLRDTEKYYALSEKNIKTLRNEQHQ